MIIPFLIYFLLEDAFKYLKSRRKPSGIKRCRTDSNVREYLRSA